MGKTVTRAREVFTYSELSSDAQDRAAEVLAAEAWDVTDSETITEDINGEVIRIATGDSDGCASTRELSDRFGVRVYWQVGYVQSDHAHLDGIIVCADWPAFEWPDRVTQVSVRSGRYGSTVTCIYVTDDDGDEWREDHGPLFETCADHVRDICHELYRFARAACEGYTSLSACLERIDDAWPRRFLADGTFAPPEYWEES